MKKLLSSILCLFLISNTFAQQWTNYTVASTSTELCNNNINCIFVDAQNNKWFGTYNGISKFDGTNWTTYLTAPGLDSSYINCIAMDTLGSMWFGTDKGVSKFDGTNWTTYTTTNGLINNNVYNIAIDAQGNIWFETHNGGVSKFDGTNWTSYSTANGLTGSYLYSMTIDTLGNAWFGTDNGVSKFDGTSWTTYTSTDGLADNNVYSIAIDAQGNKWFGTSFGVSKFDGTNWTTYLTTETIICITIDAQGNMWFGIDNGVTKFDGTNWTTYTTANGLADNRVNSIAIDSQGNKWFGTNVGASMFDGSNWIKYTTNGLTNNKVNCKADDIQGNMWFGTSAGVSKFDGTSWTTYTTTNGLANNKVYSIAIDASGNKWFGTMGGGISKFDGTNWTTYTMANGLANNITCSIAIDAQGNKWFGTINGVSKFNGTNWTTYNTANGLANNYVNSIAIVAQDIKWFGTNGGVSKFDGTNWTTYTTANGLASNHATCIAADVQGNIWVGSDNGVSKFDGTSWTIYTTANGLPNNLVNSIDIDDQGNVWIGGSTSISKFDGTSWTSYTIANSLAYNSIHSITIDAQGNKWLGTKLGAIKFSDGGPGHFQNIYNTLGIVFNDFNGNGIKESNEANISQQIIQIDSNYTCTQDNGLFYCNLPNGNHTIQYHAPTNWQLTTNDSILLNIPNSGDTIVFGIKTINNIHDLQANIAGGSTRANFDANYWLNYTNKGTVVENGTVEMKLDDRSTFVSATPIPTSQNGNTLTWNFSNLNVNETKPIHVVAHMPDVQYLGDTLINTVSISPFIADVDTLNNIDTLAQVLTGSYDPNDKMVQEGVLNEKFVLFNTPLTYTIRFQNTGTDTAFNVNIYDTINSNMDMSSLQIIGSSHNCIPEVRGTNEVLFHFYNIMLPDSNKTQLGSNGYLQYRISPKAGLPENTVVKNTAYIFFDYNPAIITNTTLNTYVSTIPKTSSIQENNLINNVLPYPNPAQDHIQLMLPSSDASYNMEIKDMQGRVAKKLSNLNDETSIIDVSDLQKGVYIFTLKNLKTSKEYKGKVVIK
ncbi:MAG: two-component regulator propeller domain-containing protein [Bacteroidota bacterium]